MVVKLIILIIGHYRPGLPFLILSKPEPLVHFELIRPTPVQYSQTITTLFTPHCHRESSSPIG